MTRSGQATLILSLFLSMTGLYAQSTGSMPTAPVPSTASSIATLDFNAAVLGTAEAKKSLGALQKKYLPQQQQLQKLNDDIEASKKVLNDSGDKLTEAERDQRLQDLATKEKQLQREAEDFKNDSQAESQQAFQQVAQKVFSFLQEFSQQHGYAAVLERGTDTSPVVWYAAGNVDITDQIIKSYDARTSPSPSSVPDKPASPRSSLPAAPKRP